MVIRSLIKPNEWDSIINKVLVTPEKGKAKKQLASENKKLHDKLIADATVVFRILPEKFRLKNMKMNIR